MVLTTLLGVHAREAIVITDLAGNEVRTLVDGCRRPGAYEDGWDGKDAHGARVKDGQYRWVAMFDDGLHAVRIDRSKELDGDFELKSHPEYPPWDPFQNVPLRFSHTFERPGSITLVFARDTYYVTPSCEPPKFFCRVLGYQPAGEFEYEWAGVDDAGTLRRDLHGIFVISHHEDLAKNAIVVFGGAPKVSGVTITPPFFRPGAGLQEIGFSLRTYHGEHVTGTISIVNQESRSTLRTIVLPDAVPGRVTATWDGRADNGIPVAPGRYTVSVRVADALGQHALGEILTMIEY